MNINREEWLNQVGDAILDDIVAPMAAELGIELDAPAIRYSVGFPPNSRGGKVIGVCLSRCVSDDQHNEIFISPTVLDSALVASTLVHEIIHAVLDNRDGHKGDFAHLARACGLVGKLTETEASKDLAIDLQRYIDALGPIPAASVQFNKIKKQSGRQHKVFCTECDFKFNTSQMQIDRLHDDSVCPICLGYTLKQEIK